MDLKYLEVSKISKSFGDKRVLNKITTSIIKGTIYSIIGPSGSGKSTLLRIIDLLEKPDEGELIFDGINLQDLKLNEVITVRRRMTFFFQKPVMFNMSVFDNVAYGLNLRKIKWDLVKEKVRTALEKVHLKDFEKQNALLLSGGEAQRVALARCMVVEPELWLLDEPTANLDPPNVALIERIIKELNEKNKVTMVIATHNMLQAKRLGHKVGFLLEGELMEEGEPNQIFNQPKNDKTRAFIDGTMIY